MKSSEVPQAEMALTVPRLMHHLCRGVGLPVEAEHAHDGQVVARVLVVVERLGGKGAGEVSIMNSEVERLRRRAPAGARAQAAEWSVRGPSHLVKLAM